MGVSPELLPRLFDLFVQGQRTLDRARGGLGLGLTIVRTLVELHGGTVAASSEGRGKGSTFSVRLPLVSVDAVTEETGKAHDGLNRPPLRRRRRAQRILVVDDNQDAAESLAEALSALGHETQVAFDGPEALRCVGDFAPSVALLDIGLPVMDGYELARRLREVDGLQDLLLVAITGYGQDSDRRRSADAGFAHHLVKPVEMERVMALIDDQGRRKRQA
jgi:CheY-like chemotaxis protein